jgi:hypothetical protein
VNRTGQDPYATLGVSRTASLLEIARARRRLAKRYHPDLGGSDDALARMQAINAAWDLLSDPVARRSWDSAHAGAAAHAAARHEWAYADQAWPMPPTGRHTGRGAAPPTGVARGWQDSGWVAAGVILILAIAVLIVAIIATETTPIPDAPDAPWVQGNDPDY